MPPEVVRLAPESSASPAPEPLLPRNVRVPEPALLTASAPSNLRPVFSVEIPETESLPRDALRLFPPKNSRPAELFDVPVSVTAPDVVRLELPPSAIPRPELLSPLSLTVPAPELFKVSEPENRRAVPDADVPLNATFPLETLRLLPP